MNKINFNPFYGLFVILVLFFILWLFYGGENHAYIGVDPLYTIEEYKSTAKNKNKNTAKNNSYLNSRTGSQIESVCSSINYEQELSYSQLQKLKQIKSERIKLLSLSKENLEKIPVIKDKVQTDNHIFVSKAERECKKIADKLFNCEFKKIRPNWLKNPETGRNLELDLYCENVIVRGISYRVAFEISGIQHFQYPNVFHKSVDEFKAQVRRDMYKAEICEREGVYLITIPYTVKLDKIGEYILNMLPECLNLQL
jgi:hypothetical protein